MKEKELTSTAEVTETVEPAAPAAPAAPAVSALPDGYLVGGYYAPVANGAQFLRPEFVCLYAKQIAAGLSSMKPADFNTLTRTLKQNKKKTLPFAARQTALYELLPKAQVLVCRRKAPLILVNLIVANMAAVHTDEDWNAMLRHFEAIYGYLCYTGGDLA